MFELNFYVGIATHDTMLIEAAKDMLTDFTDHKNDVEFQMLYGVRGDIAKQLVKDGYRLRVYVPYGEDWYAYSMRRLQENPNIMMHVTKAFFMSPFRR